MPDFRDIYATQAQAYDRLVAREDYQGNIIRALAGLEPHLARPFSEAAVVELGAGTGRLTRLLAPRVRHIYAFDRSAHMLDVAVSRPDARGVKNWDAAVADHRALPVGDRTADLVIAGWSLGHLVGWYPETWRVELGRVLAETQRVLRSGGMVVILETLGTGCEQPAPPMPGLAAYYRWLENTHGFRSTWIRTDYRFRSEDEAVSLIRFFFGDELADVVGNSSGRVVAECTGVWWKAGGSMLE
ncbi:MAG: class I SAM-dependent methyltransferase [Anaerolineae bacterium]